MNSAPIFVPCPRCYEGSGKPLGHRGRHAEHPATVRDQCNTRRRNPVNVLSFFFLCELFNFIIVFVKSLVLLQTPATRNRNNARRRTCSPATRNRNNARRRTRRRTRKALALAVGTEEFIACRGSVDEPVHPESSADVGLMIHECVHCGALLFAGELTRHRFVFFSMYRFVF